VYDDVFFGGFGKQTQELVQFIQEINVSFDLPLDVVYTGKMFFQMMKMKKPNDGSVLIFHTGGLQGNPLAIFG
jgi:1-aminocyclopropane-1-carboxylate deaminase